MKNQDAEEKAADDADSKEADSLLKGIEAFSLGVALFASTVAVAHGALQIISHSASMYLAAIMATPLLLLSVLVTMVGTMAIILGLDLLKIWKSRQPIHVVDLSITVTWIIFTYAFLYVLGSS